MRAAVQTVCAYCAALLIAASGATASAATAGTTLAPPLRGFALLVDRPGLRVFVSPFHANTPCPHLLSLPTGSLAAVKKAVKLAMPPFERRLKLDGRDAKVSTSPARRSGLSFIAGGCGRTAWSRSVVARVVLPHVEKYSASLSQHTLAVGRVRQGWLIWGYIH